MVKEMSAPAFGLPVGPLRRAAVGIIADRLPGFCTQALSGPDDGAGRGLRAASQGLRVGLAGADAHRLLHVNDEDLAVADLVR